MAQKEVHVSSPKFPPHQISTSPTLVRNFARPRLVELILPHLLYILKIPYYHFTNTPAVWQSDNSSNMNMVRTKRQNTHPLEDTTVAPSTFNDGLPLPKLMAFDLDYTLWPFWVDTHVSAPVKPRDNNSRCVDR